MEPTTNPNPWMIVPFGVLLAAVALAPLFLADWWQKHYSTVVWSLGAITVAYYLIGLNGRERVWHTAVDYVSFIALIGSLFVVSGGIHINVKGEATPLVNVLFLFIGAVVANLFGTTGASMLLIRPWLRMNKYRITAHHVVFFIFIVSNVGGCLTPIGDPPLFLGYLKGIPFWWVTARCLPAWGLAVGALTTIFYALDRLNFLAAPRPIREEQTAHETLQIEGLHNLGWLALILGAVFLKHPAGLREVLMVLGAIGSYRTTAQPIYDANHFSFGPIK